MRWSDVLRPVGMQRVALLAPAERLRDLLVQVANEGTVDFDEDGPRPAGPMGTTPAATRLQRLAAAGALASLALQPPDLDQCEQAGHVGLIAGEAQLEGRAAEAVTRRSVCALAGWVPAGGLRHLTERVSGMGGAVVPMSAPPGAEPPTLLSQEGPAREFAPLVETYGTVPYADLDPSLLAGTAYVLMFGIMFADVGHGALVLLAAAAIRRGCWRVLSRLRPVWLFLAAAGLSSMVFGVLYGEFFGPTRAIPVLWLAPLDHPVPLLGAGAVFLAGAYALGSINRFREGGWRLAVYAPSGLADGGLFLGLGAVAGAVYFGFTWLAFIGGAITVTGVTVAYIGLFASAGGGAVGAAQAGGELFDMVARLFSNLVSFARLAAFGLTHAALGQIVWEAASGLANRAIAVPSGSAAARLSSSPVTH